MSTFVNFVMTTRRMFVRPDGSGPLYQRVYRALRNAISDGRLPSGKRLPGTRALARDMNVSRTVVLAAYDQLAAEGFIEASVGSGSRVAEHHAASKSSNELPRRPNAAEVKNTRNISAYARRAKKQLENEARSPVGTAPLVDFRFTHPVPDRRTLMLWRQAVSRAASQISIEYPEPAGYAPLRELLARHVREERGVCVEADDLLIVNGAQQAMDLIARALCDRGAAMGIEDPHYAGTRAVFSAIGARLVPCPVDQDGLDIDRYRSRLRGVRALYVTPSCQFPTGATMSIARRRALLEWSARNDVWVIEDDYDSAYRFGAGQLPALQGSEGAERVLYIGAFARAMFPGLRLAFLAVPPPLRSAFRAIKWLTDRGTAPLEQRALASFMESGEYERARRRTARALAEKSKRLLAGLRAELPFEVVAWGAPSAAHVFVRFPGLPRKRTAQLIARAAAHGVAVYSGEPYHLVPPRDATLVLGHSKLSAEQIDRGISLLAAAYSRTAAKC
jgi:GntR family transcriptional regulator / MocR family aminotransferase